MNKTSLYIGIAGAIGMAVCDMILLGLPVPGSSFDLSSFGAMPGISPMRAAIGSTGGLFCAFLICFGYWYLHRKFETIDASKSLLLFVSLSSVMFFGGAFHAAYFFLAPHGYGVSSVNDPLWIIYRQHIERISYLGVPGFLLGTVLFFWLASDHRFPKWYRFANPLVLNSALLLLFFVMPAPVGGYLKPAFMNVANLLFFLIVWKVGERRV